MRWASALPACAALAAMGCALVGFEPQPTPAPDAPTEAEAEASPAAATAGPRVAARVQHGLRYVPDHWPVDLAADVHLPGGAGPHAVVLLVPGRAWAAGDCADLDHVAQRLAREGFVTVCPAYRLAPEWHHPAALDDLREALRWIRSKAFPAAVDPARIAAYGYASGGHLASLLGLSDAGALRAIVAGGTPFNLLHMDQDPWIAQYIGITDETRAGRYAEASPLSHVDAADPPMFIYHGGADRAVPLAQAESMQAVLELVGVRSELYVAEGLGHVTMSVLDGRALDRAVEFLQRELGS